MDLLGWTFLDASLWILTVCGISQLVAFFIRRSHIRRSEAMSVIRDSVDDSNQVVHHLLNQVRDLESQNQHLELMYNELRKVDPKTSVPPPPFLIPKVPEPVVVKKTQEDLYNEVMGDPREWVREGEQRALKEQEERCASSFNIH